MTVTGKQIAAAVDRYQQAREDAGLPRLIDDDSTLRLIAAVIASSRNQDKTEKAS